MFKRVGKRPCYGIVLAGLTLFAAFPASVAAAEPIKIGGTGTGLGVMAQLASAYEKKHPGVIIEVLPSLGSPGSIKAVLGGAIAIAVPGRPLTDEERKAGAVAIELARTPFVFAANPAANKDSLSSAELEQIFSGEILTWPNGQRIRLILRPARETSTIILDEISPAMERALVAASGREGMSLAATDQENAALLVKIPGSLGTSTLTQIITEQLPLKVLAYNGVKPSVAALANGSYPLYKPLYLVTTAKTQAAARRFAEFIRSPQGRKILTNAGNLVVDEK